ncbi:hypothetical protein ACQCT5_10485 [Sutcliffiella halmapala]
MIKTEKAFDMLPFVADIYEKLDLQGYVQKNIIKAKDGKTDELQVNAGIKITVFVMKNSPKIKEEIFHIVALAQEKDVEEVKSQPLIHTINTFKAIFANDELVSFFKSAMQ